MKTLTLFLLLSFASCKAQETVPFIPSNYIGEWVKSDGTDTIVITSTNIKWNSNEVMPFVSFIDIETHKSDNFYVFKSNPNFYILSLEKLSRNKIKFHAQTWDEGYERADGIYIKQVRVNQEQ